MKKNKIITMHSLAFWLRAKLHGATQADLTSYFGIQGVDAKNSTPLLSLAT
jgi:hypothetical protein